MLVDTHCHLADPAYDPDRSEVLQRAWSSGLAHVVVIGESPAASDRALALAAADDRLSTTAGIHPHDAKSWTPDAADWLRERLRNPRVVAAGEMGLDYHYDHSPRAEQRRRSRPSSPWRARPASRRSSTRARPTTTWPPSSGTSRE